MDDLMSASPDTVILDKCMDHDGLSVIVDSSCTQSDIEQIFLGASHYIHNMNHRVIIVIFENSVSKWLIELKNSLCMEQDVLMIDKVNKSKVLAAFLGADAIFYREKRSCEERGKQFRLDCVMVQDEENIHMEQTTLVIPAVDKYIASALSMIKANKIKKFM